MIMKRPLWPWIAIIIFILLIITQVSCSNVPDCQQLQDQLKAQTEYLDLFSNYFMENLALQKSSQSNDSLKVLNLDGDEFDLQSLRDDSTIFLFYPGTLCEGCYENLFKEISNATVKFSKSSRIIVLSNFTNLRSAKLFASKYGYSNNLYVTKSNSFVIVLNNCQVPYFFILDPYGQKEYVLILDNRFPWIVNYYFHFQQAGL